MRAFTVIVCCLVGSASAFAQDPPPRIPFLAADLHATVPRFPSSQELADSRNLTLAELPGAGLGGQVSVHLYPVRWRAITFGIGGEVAGSRSRYSPPSDSETTLQSTEEKFLTVAPQLSF